MILLDWIPEFFLFSMLFITLVCLNFKIFSQRSLALFVALASMVAMFYYGIRIDLEMVSTPLKIFQMDSMSHFGRLFTLLMMILGSVSIHFHHQVSFVSKQKFILFLLFLCLFLNVAFIANSVLLYLVAWIGGYLAVQNIILIENSLSKSWTAVFSRHTAAVSLVVALFLVFLLITTVPTGSLYFSDYLAWIKGPTADLNLIRASGAILLVLGTLLSHRFVLSGKGPFGLAITNLSLFSFVSIFWIRFGIPFLNESAIIPKTTAQLMLGGIFAFFSLRFAMKAFQTLEPDRWVSAIFPGVIGMGWMSLLLTSDQAQPIFYVIMLSFSVTFFLAGHAFLERNYQNKVLILSSLFALVGAPPLILGEQFYRILRSAIQAGLIPIGVLVVLIWFMLCAAGFQMANKIILFKNQRETHQESLLQEFLILGIYCVCVICLTVYRPALITFLNAHPAPHLW